MRKKSDRCARGATLREMWLRRNNTRRARRHNMTAEIVKHKITTTTTAMILVINSRRLVVRLRIYLPPSLIKWFFFPLLRVKSSRVLYTYIHTHNIRERSRVRCPWIVEWLPACWVRARYVWFSPRFSFMRNSAKTSLHLPARKTGTVSAILVFGPFSFFFYKCYERNSCFIRGSPTNTVVYYHIRI